MTMLIVMIVGLVLVTTAPVLVKIGRAVSAWWTGHSEGSW